MIFTIVYWPTCLMSVMNEATEVSEHTDKDLAACSGDCRTAAADECLYWSFNKTATTCKFYTLLKVTSSKERLDVVTGEKFCTGTCK